ncbi:carcinine hydrolase/isopenicillin-N N-acyltransferase family protein [Chloroflexota bacterium]
MSDLRTRVRLHAWLAVALLVVLALLSGCWVGEVAPAAPSETGTTTAGSPPSTTPTPDPTPTLDPEPTDSSRADGLSGAQENTLSSLKTIDDYPLYTMHYDGDYARTTPPLTGENRTAPQTMPERPSWACSLFAALGDGENRIYGRNFDWVYSPALLLFTDPPGGYASVSMVDIAYLGFGGDQAHTLPDLTLSERAELLEAPFWPFDGMNEKGVVVGMAAVPTGRMLPDPNKETIGSLGVIREILDHASDVDEAIAILQNYNIDFRGGPDLHYLIADREGQAALIEFYQGEMVVTSNDTPWHLATNFLRASAGDSAEGHCRRYDTLSERLSQAGGSLGDLAAMSLLGDVAQPGTQWSIVYGLTSGEVDVVMGRDYSSSHSLRLNPGSE